jgi:hypothetical protein
MLGVRARHLPSAPGAFTPVSGSGSLLPPGGQQFQNQDDHPMHHHKLKKATKTTKTPPPTSPHKLNQVAVFDVVAEVADVHAVLPLAVLRKLDRFLVWRVDGTA